MPVACTCGSGRGALALRSLNHLRLGKREPLSHHRNRLGILVHHHKRPPVLRRRFAKRGRTFSLGLNTNYNTRDGDNNLLSSTVSTRDTVTNTNTLNQFSRLDQTGWAWNGSFNYTEPANDYNDENIFVLGSVDPVIHGIDVAADPTGDLAKHMKTEIQRIISDLSEKYVP